MTVLREILARFGVQVDTAPLVQAEAGIGRVIGSFRQLGATLASGLALYEIKSFVTEMTRAGAELDDTSHRLGVSVKSLQSLRYAAKLSGVEADAMTNSLRLLSRNAYAASTGNKTAAKAFRELGTHVVGSNGQIRDTQDIFADLAQGFTRIPSPAKRVGLAMQVFGRAGAQLIPLLEQGSAGVAQLRQEFEDLGGGLSDDTVAAAAKADDAMDRLDFAMLSLKGRIAVVVLPIVESMVSAIGRASGAFTHWADKSNIVKAILLTMGAAALYFGAQFLLGFAGPILVAGVFAVAIAFIILLVDDLITLFSGGKSVIGGFIDEMFGAGTAAELVLELKEAWEGVVLAVENATDAVRGFLGADVHQTEFQRQHTGGRAADQSQSQRRDNAALQAARLGQQTGAWAGESQDQVNARNQRVQAQLQAERAGAPAATGPRQAAFSVRQVGRLTVPVAAQRGVGPMINAPTEVHINIAGDATPAAIARARAAVEAALDERNRAAAAALTQEAPAGADSNG